jgi:hypothetical protein
MEKIKLKDIDELYNTVDTIIQVGDKLLPLIDHYTIDFDISFPINISRIKNIQKNIGGDGIVIRNCTFNKTLILNNDSKNYIFNNCDFNEFNPVDKTYSGKIRFHNCRFHKELKFDNVVFKDLVDFWHSTFKGKVIFYKVDFEATAVFSISTFKENVLFTYSKIKEQAIFRGTTIEKGVDFSLAIITGNLAIFDFTIKNFDSVKRKLSKMEYEDTVSNIGDIPIKNKRETFRIIKKQLTDQKNTIDANKFAFLESITFRKQMWFKITSPFKFDKSKFKKSWNDLKSKTKEQFIKVKDWFFAVANYGILTLNRVSNNHNTSYLRGLLFTISIGILFYYLLIINSGKYVFSLSLDQKIISENIPGFFNFLIPTHKFNFLGVNFIENFKPNNWFYLWDTLGRVFVGYGIYQTIQAFRKYR